MKQTIKEADLDKLAGRFIIQIDTDNPITLKDRGINLSFYLEKRIRFISYGKDCVISSDLYGNTFSYTKEKFVDMFNEYLGDSKGQRYHRLLYTEELDVLFDWMKRRNY